MQACVCEDIAKSEQRIRVSAVKKKFGKYATLVSGFEKGMDVKKIAKDLKAELGCGGTVKNGEIELQGDHRKKIKQILSELGFNETTVIGD